MLSTLKKLFWISRPLSWPNTVYPFLVGYLLLAGAPLTGWQVALLVIGTIYFIAPYNLLMYGVNDVYDYESDIKNPRKGGVEGMKESRAFHPIILSAVVWTNAPFLLTLLLLSDWPARAVLTAVVFAAIAYSLKGLRFKEIPFVDSLTSSFHFVGPLLFAVALTGFNPIAWPWVVAFFLWGIASHAFGAIQDINPDRSAKISSIATVLGARATIWLSLIFYSAAVFIVALQGMEYLAIAIVGLLYCVNIIPFLKTNDKNSAKTNRGWRRFLWLNYVSGTIVTMVILAQILL